MGYESRLYVVRKSDTNFSSEEGVWGEMIASFDLCSIDDSLLSPIMEAKDTDIFFLEGNSYVREDKYGQPLKEIPLEDMIAMIANTMRTSHYRRYKPCLSLLTGFNQSEWNNKLVVLHYGY